MDQPVENKQICYPDSNRVGKFNITHEQLRNGAERPMLQALFGLCVVFDVEEHESGRGKTYYAASELFQPLLEGEEFPEYRIEFAAPGVPFPNPEHQARRLDSREFGFIAVRQIIVRVPPAQMSYQPHVIH